MINKLFNSFTLGIAAIVAIMGLQFAGVQYDSELIAQTNLRIPTVSTNAAYTPLSIKWTAGTLNNGGTAVSVTASSVALSGLRNACTAPSYTACNILWANASGTVSMTSTSTAIMTAAASGNSIMAFIETSSTAITRIVFPLQNSLAQMPVTTRLDCGTSVVCATPTAVSGGLRSIGGSLSVATTSSVIVLAMSPAFTSTATYGCTATIDGATAAIGRTTSYSRTSASTITLFLAGVAGSETVTWNCTGY